MESPCKGLCVVVLRPLLLLSGLLVLPAEAIEPTPPIVFIDPEPGAKHLSLVVDSAQVKDVELTFSLFQDGELRGEEKLDYSRFEVQSLDAFPVPDELFQLREQRENASSDGKSDDSTGSDAHVTNLPKTLRIEGLRELKVDRQKLLDRLRGGVDVTSNSDVSSDSVVAFQIPITSDLLQRQKDGFYAASYWVSASLTADPQAKRFENQHWLWFHVQGGRVDSLSLARYSAASDPPMMEKDPLTGELSVIYLGRSGREEVPLEQTEKFKAQLIELNTGAEREDSGAVKDRKLEQAEADER